MDKEIRFSVIKEDTELFVAILALGILESIKSNDLLHEIGTWSIARPGFWRNLKKQEIISEKLLNIVKQFDELNLRNELDPIACSDDIDKMITKLKDIISNVNEDTLRINSD